MKKDHTDLQHQPFLAPIWLTAMIVVLGLAAVVFAAWVWGTAGSTTVIVVRQAESDANSGVADPPLNQIGEGRAALLARLFGDAKSVGHVSAIYVSPDLRSRLTAAPLAADLGIKEIVVPTDDPRTLAHQALKERSGSRVLIVGQARTMPQIVGTLSGNSKIPEIDNLDYGTIYIVTVPRIGHSNLLHLHY